MSEKPAPYSPDTASVTITVNGTGAANIHWVGIPTFNERDRDAVLRCAEVIANAMRAQGAK